MIDDDDPFAAIGRTRHRAFAREYSRLRRSIGLDPDAAGRQAVNVAFCAYVSADAALAKARRLLNDPRIQAAILAAARMPR